MVRADLRKNSWSGPLGARDVQDSDVCEGLAQLVCCRQLDATELLEFLQEQRTAHVWARELRTELRRMGKRWKQVEKLASKAVRESNSYLGELRDLARGIETSAGLLSKFFISPACKRPLEIEIADCKQEILRLLRKRGVREVNQYGWLLLRAVFEHDGRPEEEKIRSERLELFLNRLEAKFKAANMRRSL